LGNNVEYCGLQDPKRTPNDEDRYAYEIKYKQIEYTKQKTGQEKRPSSLLLLRRCWTHLLIERSVRDLQASKSVKSNIEDGYEKEECEETHENSCGWISG
jgi:hypothetical protein